MKDFLQGFFGKKKKDDRATTDAELNAIFGPLRDSIVAFKDETKISWSVILPAVQKMSTRLLVRSRGLEATRLLYSVMMDHHDRTQRIPTGAFLGVTITPESPPEHLAQTNILLSKFANDMIAKGYPIEHIAQAFGAFAIMTAEKVGDNLYATALMVETYKELQSDDFA